MKRFKKFKYKRYQNQRFMLNRMNSAGNEFRFVFNSNFEREFKETQDRYCDVICANNPYLYARVIGDDL